ncbi:MAG: hypothetical protein KIT09_03705 [Bryobacteraceae bacterium]|nr:hypothetical protein [Bryobacteraceae bacterium]
MTHWQWIRTLAIAVLFAPALWAAGGGGAETIVLVADSRRYAGWKAWWMNLYNESHLYFAIFTIVVVPTVGLILGKATDWLMARTGINLKSRILAEH